MRSLTSTLLTAQKSDSIDPKPKIVLTQGANSYTYEDDRIKYIQHSEEMGRQSAQVVLDNSDGALTSLDLKGYQGVISGGLVSTSGSEYSAHAPLYVIAQQLQSRGGVLFCLLALAGIPNLLSADKASGEYTPDSSDTQTVKTLIRKILGDTGVTILSVYSHCTLYDASFDSEDDLIDSYKPRDSFTIRLNSNRLDKIQELLAYTKCIMRAQADGKIHIFKPIISTSTAWQASHAYVVNDTVIPTTANEVEYKCTTAGTSGGTEPTWPTEVGQTVTDGTVVWTVSYDYDYRLTSGYHTFLEKSYRKRLVIPNYIQVDSLASQSTAYTGYAEDTESSALIAKRDFKRMRVDSNAQATSIATAILSHYQLEAERGHGLVPINLGQEIGDFVKIKDSREDDYRVGNVLYINRVYRPGLYQMEIRFGKLGLASLLGTASPSAGGITDLQALWDYIMWLQSLIEQLTAAVAGIQDWINWFYSYIFIDASGDIVLNPKYNSWVQIIGDLSITSEEFFGLMLASSDSFLRWYDKGGTLDHTFRPETTGHGKLGDASYKWLSGYINKAYHNTRLQIPVGTDMYD